MRKRIKANQIELAANTSALDQLDQLARVLHLVVDAIEHAVFEGDEITGRMLQ